jgi:glycosyltransferase involved in cell wall biosynthesis
LPFIIKYVLTIKNAIYVFPHHHFWHAVIIFFLKIVNKKTILAVHDDKMHKGLETSIEMKTTNYQIRATDRHVYISDYVRKSVIKNTGIAKPSIVIPLGPFIYNGMKNTIRDIGGKKQVEITLFGTIAKYKGIEIILGAYKQLKEMGKNVHLNIIGKHVEENLVNEKDIINYEVNVQNDFIPNDKMHLYFDNTDIIVLPYIEASQSGVLPVANYCCIPSIVTNVGGLAENICNGQNGLLCNPDIESLKIAILQLLEDNNLYKNISINIKNEQINNSWENISKKWLAFINDTKE